MKNRYLIGLVLLFAINSMAQDSDLPAGEAHIYLKSGKTIKKVSLWGIDTMRVKFVREGNLDEILTSDVENIETEKYFIRFDGFNRYSIESRDFIVLKEGDTLYGSINEVNLYYIYYSKPFSTLRKSIIRSKTKSYFWKDEPFLTKIANDTTENQVITQRENRNTKPTDTIPSDQSPEVKKNADYYFQSYKKGVEDAEEKSTTGMGVAGFLVSFIFGSHYLVSGALNEKAPPEIPGNVEPRLYTEGYKKTMALKKGRSAANGAAAGKTIMLVIILGSIVSAF